MPTNIIKKFGNLSKRKKSIVITAAYGSEQGWRGTCNDYKLPLQQLSELKEHILETYNKDGEVKRLYLYYIQLVVDYHIAGRFGVIEKMNPTAGNFLHHAVEMYLKAALCKCTSGAERTKLKHDLPLIWSRYKAQYPDSKLNTFDSVIAGLHRFEELRYPERIGNEGAQINMGFVREKSVAPRSYGVYLNEIDLLVAELWKRESWNPSAFISGTLSRGAFQYLTDQNSMPFGDGTTPNVLERVVP